ncbi:MAG: metallophosphoesterase family protein [Gemmatimonadetes bacterium]|nr:metallophosphoesterase family protein [Gemmatimonadota bacterium]
MRVGVISDTHGLLRNEVYAVFEGVERVIHAGDMGEPGILVELEVLAPVTAVCGNVDPWDLRASLPEVAHLELEGAQIVVVHGHQWGSPKVEDLLSAHHDADVIIYGHTHKPLVERRGRTLVVNPGSAGPRRFGQQVTVAILEVGKGRAPSARIVPLLGAVRGL